MSLWVSIYRDESYKNESGNGDDYDRNNELFSANITHNLNQMAEESGIYSAVWRPEEIGIVKASELIPLLRDGIAKMKADPAKYEKLSAKNGWGTYEQFIPWLERYLEACETYPDGYVNVGR